MPVLDQNTAEQLKSYLTNLKRPITLTASLGECDKSRDMRELIEVIASLSDQVSAETDGDAKRKPSFSISAEGSNSEVGFAGLPLGHEFSSLILALLHVGGHPPKEDADLLDTVRELEGEYHFESFFSLSCQNCPDVVQALNIMAALNPNITHTAIDGALFQNEVEAREVMAVPSIFLNGEPFASGRMDLAQIVAKLDSGALAKAAEKISAKEPFDVLVVGGGPAGAAAAVYTARKGIRTGIVSEKFGGQLLDTLGIENFISVQHTEGPKLASELEQHVLQYGVDIIDAQKVSSLGQDDGSDMKTLTLESGAELKAKSVILATGARWRQIGVPGEEEYRNRGVAYCPHCDGPLYKGKDVAVIGGGNSGVEAAIDLAGLVNHVTLFEFADTLRADAVLQSKLASLPNVDIVKSAQTSEIMGDGSKVTGLAYTDRATGEDRKINLDGVFVQIGLIPNTEWLDGDLALSAHGEIETDVAGATNIPGVFAAGDATTVPYKQIVVAMGQGSKAGLAAFDYLIRHDANAEKAAA